MGKRETFHKVRFPLPQDFRGFVRADTISRNSRKKKIRHRSTHFFSSFLFLFLNSGFLLFLNFSSWKSYAIRIKTTRNDLIYSFIYIERRSNWRKEIFLPKSKVGVRVRRKLVSEKVDRRVESELDSVTLQKFDLCRFLSRRLSRRSWSRKPLSLSIYIYFSPRQMEEGWSRLFNCEGVKERVDYLKGEKKFLFCFLLACKSAGNLCEEAV